MGRKHPSAQFRTLVVDRIRGGEHPANATDEIGCGIETVYRWLKRAGVTVGRDAPYQRFRERIVLQPWTKKRSMKCPGFSSYLG